MAAAEEIASNTGRETVRKVADMMSDALADEKVAREVAAMMSSATYGAVKTKGFKKASLNDQDGNPVCAFRLTSARRHALTTRFH